MIRFTVAQAGGKASLDVGKNRFDVVDSHATAASIGPCAVMYPRLPLAEARKVAKLLNDAHLVASNAAKRDAY